MSSPAARRLRIATRGSAQARAQAEAVGTALSAADGGLSVEYVIVETLGDRRADEPLHSMGGQGVFVKDVQRAVLDGHADIAVHSAKDLPSALTAGLRIGAFCARRDPADALVGRALDQLGHGATVASGSVRRRALLQTLRPDLHFVELRGNIHTRLGKVPADGSIVMAVAALETLGLTDHVAQRFDEATFVPAPGQGCVAVECRADDEMAGEALRAVDHGPTRAAVEAERAFLAELGTGCSLPVGAYSDGRSLTGFLADPDRRHDGGHWWARQSVSLSGVPGDDAATAARIARELQLALGQPAGAPPA
ncbi:MAG: hydroxymethylbilane synthase [Ilumatobacteraceae bacterium]